MQNRTLWSVAHRHGRDWSADRGAGRSIFFGLLRFFNRSVSIVINWYYNQESRYLTYRQNRVFRQLFGAYTDTTTHITPG